MFDLEALEIYLPVFFKRMQTVALNHPQHRAATAVQRLGDLFKCQALRFRRRPAEPDIQQER